jgi:hypothetical protein
MKLFNCLSFDNKLVRRNHNVHVESAIQLSALVYDREIYLGLERNSPQPKLVTKALLVHRLEQSRSEYPVHLNRRTENTARKRVSFQA